MCILFSKAASSFSAARDGESRYFTISALPTLKEASVEVPTVGLNRAANACLVVPDAGAGSLKNQLPPVPLGYIESTGWK